MMRAAWYDKLGPADDVLNVGEQPLPGVGPGEVRVNLKASGINPSDVKLRSGLRQGMQYPLVIANSDGAGVIDQIGEGVDPSWIRKRVWLYNGQRAGRAFGTAAEYIALDQDLVSELPDHVSFEQGACLGIPCMTAHRALTALGAIHGDMTVFVSGGAGAVGHYAVQLAKWMGARVLTTISNPAKGEIARSAGADVVINYKREDVIDRVMAETGGGGVDLIVDVDFGGNLATNIEIIKNNGAISVYASGGEDRPELEVFPFMAKNVSLHFLVLNSCPHEARQQAQDDIGRWLRDSNCEHQIAGTFPLAEIAAAHKLVESGSKQGTAVLRLDES